MEAVLKYPGAKNRLAEWIISFIPEHRVYLELFFGSGAVFFNKDPAKIETLNDLDGEVYNLFKVIRDWPEEFAKSLEMTPYSREEYENAYKKVSAETELERARKFMVRCWLGMGSSNVYKNGFRSSQQGNSPKTTKHWGELPDRVLLAAERLKHAQIEKTSGIGIIKTVRYAGRIHIPGPTVFTRNKKRLSVQYRNDGKRPYRTFGSNKKSSGKSPHKRI